MKHSEYFEKVKKFYDNGLWDSRRIYNIVAKGLITSDEYEEITGKKYKEG